MESKNRPTRCFSGGRFRAKTTSKNGETPQRLGLSGVLQKVRECFLTLHMVVAADPGSIPCKCRPAKPYLTHPSPADSCGSLDLFRSHPHLSAGFRIRSSHHFESSSSKVAPLPVAKSPMRTLPSVLVEPPILVNKLPSLPTTVEPVLV